MYAVIETGGKQYRVEKGSVIRVESLPGEPGSAIEIEQVMMVADGSAVSIGQPFVEGAKVVGTLRSHGRRKKLHIVKFRRRKHHHKQMGHRQNYTELEVTDILPGAGA